MTLPVYVPILKAMKSEAEALTHAKPSDLKGVTPLFEITKINDQIRNAARFKNVADITQSYLDEVTDRINTVWNGRPAMIDNFHWDPKATISTGEHVLDYALNRLESLGVSVIPVIGYDRWGFTEYKVALQNLDLSKVPYFCLRLEDIAFEDSHDPTYFKTNIETILSDLTLSASNCSVLIDFGDVTKHDLTEMNQTVDRLINLLKPYGFKFFVTAGCSIPSSINLAVKNENSDGKVQRKEMLLWQNKMSMNDDYPLIYGDYGIRGPNSNEGGIAPDANGKIRYTIEKHFYIVRGHSMRKGVKGEQMWALAQRLMSTTYYKNPSYSWGDAQIELCALKFIKGGHSEWISHDTSHHLIFVLEEIKDFVLMKKTKKTTT